MVYLYEPPKHILSHTREFRDWDRSNIAADVGLFEYALHLKTWAQLMLNDVDSIVSAQNWKEDVVIDHQRHLDSLRNRMSNALCELDEIFLSSALNSNATTLQLELDENETTANNITDVENFASLMIIMYRDVYKTINSANIRLSEQQVFTNEM